MSEQKAVGNFRAVLGKGGDQAFAIVTVDAYGSISWLVVSEQEFNEATYDDLPQELFAGVNDFYEKLNFSIDDPTMTADGTDEYS
ncbi:MAG TPA: hypothetical protein VIN57_04280 [Magnetovibrio sp.]